MIARLDAVSNGLTILSLLRQAYEVEARLLGVQTFPPLKRTLADLRASDSTFYGFQSDSALVGVLELVAGAPAEIASLGVHPEHFRRGIGQALVEHALHIAGPALVVHTGAANTPARALYERLHFTVRKHYRTKEGVDMVQLEC